MSFESLKSGNLEDGVRQSVRDAGCVVVRGVVASDVASGWKDSVLAYAKNNPSHRGFPPDNPQVYELYWSVAQTQARQHPNVHDTILGLNAIWDPVAPSTGVNLTAPLVYGERLRIRQPGDSTFQLGPHMDGGCVRDDGLVMRC